MASTITLSGEKRSVLIYTPANFLNHHNIQPQYIIHATLDSSRTNEVTVEATHSHNLALQVIVAILQLGEPS